MLMMKIQSALGFLIQDGFYKSHIQGVPLCGLELGTC